MRISLLIEREPFGEILTETLTRFWSRQLGRHIRVEWRWKPPRRQFFGNGENQVWLCNVYLNAIFPRGISSQALDPIRREFSRSVVAWRRPLQKAYVTLALAPCSAPWFTHALVRIVPGVEALSQQVIVPGNSKIRILDRQANCVYGVLKTGYSRERFGAEVAARQQAASLDIPVPRLTETDLEAGWFREQYVEGTPLNRLACTETRTSATQRAVRRLQRLIEETLEKTALGDYVDALRTSIHRHLTAILSLERLTTAKNTHLDGVSAQRNCARKSPRFKVPAATSPNAAAGCRSRFDGRQLHSQAVEACDQLTQQILAGSPSGVQVFTGQTHGDFQPGNVLVDGDKFWIIDWEYAARRQALYDTLVFSCQARGGQGIAKRLQGFVDFGLDPLVTSEQLEVVCAELADRALRRRHAALFLLEELDLRLAENAHPRLTAISSGLGQLLTEIKLWRACG